MKNELLEAQDTLKTENLTHEKLKNRKALINHELEKLDKE